MRAMLLAFLLCAGTAAAAGFELNGRALGQRSDEVLGDPRYDCGGVSACFLFTACVFKDASRETLYGVPLELLTLYYTGERVAAIEAQFAPQDFERVAQEAWRAYGDGQPEESTRSAPGNAVYVWRDGAQVLRLERYFAPTGRASLIITDRSVLSQVVER